MYVSHARSCIFPISTSLSIASAVSYGVHNYGTAIGRSLHAVSYRIIHFTHLVSEIHTKANSIKGSYTVTNIHVVRSSISSVPSSPEKIFK